MTTRTKHERAALSIRGYHLDRTMTIKTNDKTIKTAQVLGLINIGHKISDAPSISSWIDQKLNESINEVLQDLQNRKSDPISKK